MSAAEASEALRSYPVRTFLDWLDREMIGIGGARERGVCGLHPRMNRDDHVTQAQAMTWANCFGLALEEIWTTERTAPCSSS